MIYTQQFSHSLLHLLSLSLSLSLHMYFFTSEREKDDPLNMERVGEGERQIVCGCEFLHLTKMLMC
jgi:hypothetical protein